MAEYTIPEAAVALGVSIDTVRRRIKRGTLEARRNPQGRYVIVIPEGDGIELGGDVPVLLIDLRRELSHTQEVLGEVRHQRGQLEEQVTAQRRALESGETERAELRRLLAASMQTHALPESSAAPDTAAQAAGAVPPTHRAAVPRPWWRRLLAALTEGP